MTTKTVKPEPAHPQYTVTDPDSYAPIVEYRARPRHRYSSGFQRMHVVPFRGLCLTWIATWWRITQYWCRKVKDSRQAYAIVKEELGESV
jgi:hypothetical protein